VVLTGLIFLSSCDLGTTVTSDSPVFDQGISSSRAVSDVLWYGDPNKPLTDSFRQLNTEPGEEGTATVVNDSVYGKVWKVNKPAGSKRAEFARTNGYIPAEGDKVYVGWRTKINIAGSTNPDSGFAIFQLKTEDNGEQNHPVSIDYDGREMFVQGIDPGTGFVAPRTKTFCTKPMNENTWTSIVLGIKFSSNATVGYVEVWINGVKQSLLNDNSDKQSFHRTIDTGEMYFKWGAYNEAGRNFDISNYLCDMRVATSYTAAEPLNYQAAPGTSTSPSVTPKPSVSPAPSVAPSSTPGTIKVLTDADKRVNFSVNGTRYFQFNSTSSGVLQVKKPSGAYVQVSINGGGFMTTANDWGGEFTVPKNAKVNFAVKTPSSMNVSFHWW